VALENLKSWAAGVAQELTAAILFSLLGAVLTFGIALWGAISDLRHDIQLHTALDDASYVSIAGDVERLQTDLSEFKKPGRRYSADDGDRDRSESNNRDDKLGARLDVLDQRCRECRVTVERFDERIKRIEQDQQRQHP